MSSTLTRRALAGSFAALAVFAAGCGRSLPGAIDRGVPSLPPVQAACTDGAQTTEARIAAMPAGAVGEFIVSFGGKSALDKSQTSLLKNLGITQALTLKHLPIAGVIATREQALAMMKLPGVRSVRFNSRLTLDDDAANIMTSVTSAQQQPELVNAAGEPITGKGVTVFVNDSGIDAVHPDLRFGSKVLQNALGHVNALASTAGFAVNAPIENIPNTDVLGSHGTHVAGIVAGDGSASSGVFTGSAKGATLVGYGSGAVLFVLDSLGGFDYALQLMDEHPEYNIRVITNSFGQTDDVGTCFNPEDPTNIATKALVDKGLIVVFSAGNSGNGTDTITGNFKKAPWVITVANGTKQGQLASSSSRGSLAHPSYETVVDGETFLVEDRPTVTAPGTQIISARAIAADPFTATDTEADVESGLIPPAQLPFYTLKSGTSMAAPHVAGLVALLLEANPSMTWREVKQVLKQTASNMAGSESWEVGAGYANIEAALAMALNLRKDYGTTNNEFRTFNAEILLGDAAQESAALTYLPVGPNDGYSFEVGDDISLITAQWSQPTGNACTCAIVLTDPAGNRYGSSIALPVLGSNVGVVATGMPGTWTLKAGGIGSVTGVSLDPLKITNGVAGPANLDVTLTQFKKGQEHGLTDIAGHAAEALIKSAVAERLVDGLADGFKPDEALTRGQMGEYLMSWGVRQTRAHNGGKAYKDTDGALAAIADAVTLPGHLTMDLSYTSAPLMSAINGEFNAAGLVTREEAAYALIQAVGQEQAVKQYEGQTLFATDENQNVVGVADEADVSPALRNHVQEAIVRGTLDVEFKDGKAYVHPKREITRAEFAAFSARNYTALPAAPR